MNEEERAYYTVVTVVLAVALSAENFSVYLTAMFFSHP